MAHQIRITYPKFPFWRAEVSRIALHLGGVKFEDHHPSREEFAAMRADGRLPFGQVPVLIIDGQTIAQTGAIARLCGKLSGHYPADDLIAAAKVDQFLDAATDITNKVGPTMREKDPEKRLAARAALAEETLPKWLGYLEALAAEGASPYLVGETLTIADIAIWRLLGWLKSGLLDGIPTTLVSPFPALSRLFTSVDSTPEIQQWMRENYA